MWVSPRGRAFAVIDENGLILRTLPTRGEAEQWLEMAKTNHANRRR